ncbi:hypothetical protein EPUL_001246 [Erysiphe pulchra]|uniref:Uncharacterized protein n=1 Tax=Erysiphe pulchra TaxID=225359 RepID=A0A2S4Q149_9PEZI|nr:hypothetical protein EPUL_001246 [Erysiphe pulchra]
MNDYYPLLLALGTLAVSSGLVILVTDVISIVLYQSPSTNKAEILALVSSTFHGTTLVLMALLVCQYFKHHRPQNSDKLKPRGYLIVFAGASCIISSGVTALELVLNRTKKGNTSLDPKILRPPESLVLGAVISGAASMISQCTFVICLASLRRKKHTNKSILSMTADQSIKASTSIYTQHSFIGSNVHQKYHYNFKSTDLKPSSLKHHFLKIIEKFSSTRFSRFSSQKNSIDAPASDRLSTYQFTRSHTPNLLLLDRNNIYHGGNKTSVDINPSQSVESLALPSTLKHSNSFKFLETIPASPTDPSGGEDFRSMLPQNPQPTTRRNGSTRSFSPANSYREPKRYSRSPTPVEINRESHIHPLFRTDSSDPPAVTPGTRLTAAPGAGKVISNRASLRSLRSKKSGSSLQSRRKDVSSIENLPRFTESESRGMLQLQEPLPSYGVNFEASN